MNTKRKKKKKKPKKGKRKLSAAEKKAKKERQKKYKWIFINGKQVRIKREPEIEGIPQEEWIRQNADPIFLVQNEMWEYLDPEYFNDRPVASNPPDSQQSTISNHADLNPVNDEPPF
ncbi:hypothetical protein OAG71_00220 [bacterium]|nr:hypothetical protein [bacterium]